MNNDNSNFHELIYKHTFGEFSGATINLTAGH